MSHVVCKKCSFHIPVAGRPKGSTTITGVHTEGVHLGDGGISFGPGGRISFGEGGVIGFGPPPSSQFMCPSCGTTEQYEAHEIHD